MTVGSDTLTFGYDASGAPMYVQWNNSRFFYLTNIQGDVTAIVSVNGYAVVEYTYDAWGNILSVTGTRAENIGKLNPLRYRGYVYDIETGQYYLQSRYYRPDIGRFINADGFVSTGQGILGNNMFAYCGNNPVNMKDPTGNSWIGALILVAATAICTVLSGCSGNSPSDYGAASSYIPSDSLNYNCYAYALGETQWKYVGGSPDAICDYNVNKVAEIVLEDAEKDGRQIRPLESFDSPIESNEYRIALRTSSDDYHFMVQHNDGTWSHKPGICSTRLINGTNPSIVSWDAPQIDATLLYYFGVVEEIGFIPNFYDSNTLYFAVSK